jgi:hypothetical protein
VEQRIYTAQDGEQMSKSEELLRAKGLDESNERIVDIIDGYFQVHRNVSVTAEAIVKLVEAQSGLKWLSAAQLEYNKIAAENPQASAQLAAWLNTQGKPGQLENQGDHAYENLSLLLIALQGREVSSTTILGAEDRILHRPGRQLHRVPQPRKEMGTITEAARSARGEEDMGRHLLGDLVKNPDGSFRSKTPQEQKRDAEAAERAKSPAQTTALDESEQTWKYMADQLLLDGVHSQQQRVKAVYDREQGNGWRRVYELCKKEANLYRNSRSIR